MTPIYPEYIRSAAKAAARRSARAGALNQPAAAATTSDSEARRSGGGAPDERLFNYARRRRKRPCGTTGGATAAAGRPDGADSCLFYKKMLSPHGALDDNWSGSLLGIQHASEEGSGDAQGNGRPQRLPPIWRPKTNVRCQ